MRNKRRLKSRSKSSRNHIHCYLDSFCLLPEQRKCISSTLEFLEKEECVPNHFLDIGFSQIADILEFVTEIE